MHEVAMAQGILDVVLDIAGDQQTRTVRVTAGELLAVTEDSLQFCFQMVAQDTPAAAARLEVQIVPGSDQLLIDAVELETAGTIDPSRPMWKAWPPDVPGAAGSSGVGGGRSRRGPARGWSACMG